MYTGIRFKGYVKPEFRKEFSKIATSGEWGSAETNFFCNFGEISRSGFIPCGMLCCMPDEWEEGDYPNEKGTDGFDLTYNENSGYWAFQCSLKNYEDEIECFFNMVPKFIDKVEHLEYYYEAWSFSKRYDILDGKVKMVDAQFIEYR